MSVVSQQTAKVKSPISSVQGDLKFDLTSDEPIVPIQRNIGVGIVKNVLSGDTIIVSGKNAEKRISIGGVSAPKLGNKTTPDEPFAFQSREYLRKLLLGKKVAFILQGAESNFADVTLNDVDVATLIIQHGWATVNLPKNVKEALEEQKKLAAKNKNPAESVRIGSIEKEALYDLQLVAEKKKIGIFSTNSGQRNITWDADNAAYFEKYKNQPLKAVVDRVLDGSTLRVIVPSLNNSSQGLNQTMLIVSLAGITTPRVPITKAGEKKAAVPKFAEEVRALVESRLLHRDVEIVLKTMDKNGTLYGSVLHPKGNISTRIAEEGFAKIIPWTLNVLPSEDKNALLSAVEKAKDAEIGIYSTGEHKNQTVEEYDATVVQIVSGDIIIVRDAQNQEKKLSISSIQSPSGRAPYAFEAREFLRKSLLNKSVHVIIDYVRELKSEPRKTARKQKTKNVKKTQDNAGDIPEESESDAVPSPTASSTFTREYATVLLGRNNVAFGLVQAGYVDVVTYPRDAPRTLYYADLLSAEKAAIKSSVGKHSPQSTALEITDYTNNRNVKKQAHANEAFQSAAKKLQLLTNIHAIIEHIYSPTRVKLYIPSLQGFADLTLAGIFGPAVKSDLPSNIHDEAMKYMRSFIQQDVQIEAPGFTKSGDSILGNIIVNKQSLSVYLLKQGYATIIPFVTERNAHKKAMYEAETYAKNKQVGVWVNYDEEKEKAERERARAEALEAGFAGVYEKDGSQYFKAIITDIIDSVNFYFRNVGDKNAETISKVLSETDFEKPVSSDFKPNRGDIVAARFVEDNSWYRARIESVNHDIYKIQFLEYGNQALVTLDAIRPCPKEIMSLKPTIKLGTLSALKTPAKSTEYYEAAADALAEATAGFEFEARIDAHERRKGTNGTNADIYHLTLTLEGEKLSVNDYLLSSGWVRVSPRPYRKLESLIPELEEFEEQARSEHLRIWEYGACASDTEDNGIF